MRFKFTITLIILNLLAFGGLYLLEVRRNPLQDFRDNSAQFFLNGVHIDKLKIEINSDKLKETRVLKEERNHWDIVEPFFWPANESAVHRIISQLQFLQKEVVLPVSEIKKSKQTLADYGLEKPVVTLTFWSGEKSTELKIGSTTQLGQRLYVLAPGGENVVVVDSSLLKSLDISLKELRKPQIFNIPVFEIKSFRVQEGNRRILLEKNDDDWQFSAPIAVPADNKLVTNALGLIDAAQVVSILPEKEVNHERMGLYQPFMRVTIGNQHHRDTLVIGSPVEGRDERSQKVGLRYAMLETGKSEGTVITVKANDFEWLGNALDALRERKFMDIESNLVTSLEISQGDRTLRLQKLEVSQSQSGNAWRVIALGKQSDEAPLLGDRQVIDELISSIKNIEAQEFISDVSLPGEDVKYGFERPNAVVEVNGAQREVLLFGNIVANNPRLIYVKRQGQPYIYAVWSRILADLTANPLNYRNRILIQQPKSAKTVSFKITDLQTKKVILEDQIDPQKTTWAVALEKYPPKTREALLNIIEATKKFKVKHYISSQFEPLEKQPWRYHLEVKSILPGAAKAQLQTWDYYFAFRSRANHQVGGSPQANADFTLPQEFIDDLFAVTFEIEQPELPANPEEVESVNVELIKTEPSPAGPLPGAFLPSDIPSNDQKDSP